MKQACSVSKEKLVDLEGVIIDGGTPYIKYVDRSKTGNNLLLLLRLILYFALLLFVAWATYTSWQIYHVQMVDDKFPDYSHGRKSEIFDAQHSIHDETNTADKSKVSTQTENELDLKRLLQKLEKLADANNKNDDHVFPTQRKEEVTLQAIESTTASNVDTLNRKKEFEEDAKESETEWLKELEENAELETEKSYPSKIFDIEPEESSEVHESGLSESKKEEIMENFILPSLFIEDAIIRNPQSSEEATDDKWHSVSRSDEVFVPVSIKDSVDEKTEEQSPNPGSLADLINQLVNSNNEEKESSDSEKSEEKLQLSTLADDTRVNDYLREAGFTNSDEERKIETLDDPKQWNADSVKISDNEESKEETELLTATDDTRDSEAIKKYVMDFYNRWYGDSLFSAEDLFRKPVISSYKRKYYEGSQDNFQPRTLHDTRVNENLDRTGFPNTDEEKEIQVLSDPKHSNSDSVKINDSEGEKSEEEFQFSTPVIHIPTQPLENATNDNKGHSSSKSSEVLIPELINDSADKKTKKESPKLPHNLVLRMSFLGESVEEKETELINSSKNSEDSEESYTKLPFLTDDTRVNEDLGHTISTNSDEGKKIETLDDPKHSNADSDEINYSDYSPLVDTSILDRWFCNKYKGAWCSFVSSQENFPPKLDSNPFDYESTSPPIKRSPQQKFLCKLLKGDSCSSSEEYTDDEYSELFRMSDIDFRKKRSIATSKNKNHLEMHEVGGDGLSDEYRQPYEKKIQNDIVNFGK